MFCLVLQNTEGSFWFFQDWLGSAILFVLALLSFLLRKPLARGILFLVLSRSRRRHPEDYQTIRGELLKPLAFFVPTAFLTAAARQALFIPAAWHVFLSKLMDSLLTGLAIWLLFKTAMVVGVLILRGRGSKSPAAGVSAVSLLVSMIRFAILFIGAFVILSYWVTNVAGLVTGLGIGGLALTLAAQDTIGNFIGSLAILFDQPFSVGDWISTSEASGEVEAIGIRSSRLRASSGALLSLPNKSLAEAVVTNESRRIRRRLEITLSLPWQLGLGGADLFKSKLLARLADMENIQEPVLAVIRDLTPEGIDFYLSCFTGPSYGQLMEARDLMNRTLLDLVEEMNISLPLVQRVELEEGGMLPSRDEKIQDLTS